MGKRGKLKAFNRLINLSKVALKYKYFEVDLSKIKFLCIIPYGFFLLKQSKHIASPGVKNRQVPKAKT